jgi:hypothetical protein
MFMEPVKIISPFSGQAAFPKVTTFTENGKTYENVAWSDPVTGSLIKRGTVSIKDSKTGEVIADFKKNQNNSLTSTSYRQ